MNSEHITQVEYKQTNKQTHQEQNLSEQEKKVPWQ